MVRKLLAEHLSRTHTEPRDPSGKAGKGAALVSAPTEPRAHTAHWQGRRPGLQLQVPLRSKNITECSAAETMTEFTPKKNPQHTHRTETEAAMGSCVGGNLWLVKGCAHGRKANLIQSSL